MRYSKAMELRDLKRQRLALLEVDSHLRQASSLLKSRKSLAPDFSIRQGITRSRETIANHLSGVSTQRAKLLKGRG